MLVNDRSIVEDHSIASFSFHHVELDTHGVLLAEGLTTESYLDTGNRTAFTNDAVVSLQAGPALDASHKSWTRHACAPLATDRETVEPIWRRLLARSATDGAPEAALGHDRGPAFSDDPQLRVLLDDGSVTAARWAGGGRHLFQIPQGARPVRLLSRSAVPARSIGPFVDDRRRLGVQVKSVVFWCGLVDVVHRATDLDLDGWHAAEAGARWTDGAACLDLPRAGAAETFVEIHVVGSMRYADHEPPLLLAA
jgi:antigen 43